MRIKSVIVLFLLFYGILAVGQKSACACCSENHKAFDFWEGKWEVVSANGTKAGNNTIEKIEEGCVLQEKWVGTSGSTGISVNFYNQKENQWEQLWVDNAGTYLKLKGNRVDNQMILVSDAFTHTDGKTYRNRITWTLNDNGTVRQLWEVLEKEKVVNVAFDGLYTRIE